MTNNKRSMEELKATYLNDEAVVEFDSLLAKSRRKTFIRSTIASAASLVIFISLFLAINNNKSKLGTDINTIELLETINLLTQTNMENISTITAKPDKKGIIITTEFTDGSSRKYLMTRRIDGSIEMTAQNGKRNIISKSIE